MIQYLIYHLITYNFVLNYVQNKKTFSYYARGATVEFIMKYQIMK